jgi:hypothetical protein
MTTEAKPFNPLDLIPSAMPDVSANVFERSQDKPENPEPAPIEEEKREPHPLEGETDDKGVEFDPRIHLEKRKLTKNFNKKGIWMPRPQKRGSKTHPSEPQREFKSFTANQPPPPSDPVEEVKPKPAPKSMKKVGEMMAGMYYNLCIGLWGRSALPEDKTEFASLSEDFQEVVEYYTEIQTIHPLARLGGSIALHQCLCYMKSTQAEEKNPRGEAMFAYVKAKTANLFGYAIRFAKNLFTSKPKKQEGEEQEEGAKSE